MGCDCNKNQLEQDKNYELLNNKDSIKQDLTQINTPKMNLNINKEKEDLYSNYSNLKKSQNELISPNDLNIKINKADSDLENKLKKIKNSSKENSMISQIKNNSVLENSINNENYNPINYNLKIVELINYIRSNPNSFAENIEDAKKYIKIEKTIIKDKNTGNEIEKEKIIFKKKVKVALTKGEIAFTEASNILKNLKPISPLEFNENIVLKLPETKSQMKDSSFLKLQAEEIKRKNNIDCYFKDLVKDPFISALLMVVDDNGKISGKKRNAILNPEFKYIGVDNKFFGKTFLAYFSFSK